MHLWCTWILSYEAHDIDGNRARLDLVASVVPDEDPELETLTHLGWR